MADQVIAGPVVPASREAWIRELDQASLGEKNPGNPTPKIAKAFTKGWGKWLNW
jgi:hypothetical protein